MYLGGITGPFRKGILPSISRFLPQSWGPDEGLPMVVADLSCLFMSD